MIPLLFYLIQLSGEFQKREIRHLIFIVGGEIIVHGFAHAHLILENGGHCSYTFFILVGCYAIYILRQGVIIKLLLVVALAVVHLAHGVHIVCLHALERILVSDAGILLLYLGTSNLGTLLEAIENRHSQLDADAIGTIPVVGFARMNPMFYLIGKGRIHQTSGKAHRWQIAILGELGLLLCQFLSLLQELEFIESRILAVGIYRLYLSRIHLRHLDLLIRRIIYHILEHGILLVEHGDGVVALHGEILDIEFHTLHIHLQSHLVIVESLDRKSVV